MTKLANRISKCGLVVCTALMFINSTNVEAQSNQAKNSTGEFKSASSPTSNGGTISTYAIPGQPGSEVTRVIEGNLGRRAPVSVIGQTGQSTPGNAQFNQSPFGGKTGNLAAQNPSGQSSAGQASVGQPLIGPVTTAVDSPFTMTTLGNPAPLDRLIRQTGYNQSNLNSNAGVNVASRKGTVYNYPAAADTIPNLNPASPQTQGFVPQNYVQPGVANGTVPGAANQPAIAYRNMPPGTYMGKGIAGRPKAYVDGQPLRNFFRFFFP